MINSEHLIQLISLFKEGKVTKFALEQELALALGGRCEVRIHNDPHATTTSTFGIFPMPEMHVNGLKVIFYIDKPAIDNFYTPEELVKRLVLISSQRQHYMGEFFKFISSHINSTVSFCDALACLLKIYSSIVDILRKENQDFIIDNKSLFSVISDCEAGNCAVEEKLLINNIVPSEVIDEAKAMSHDSPEVGGVSIVISSEEKPSVNLLKQEMRSFCDGTYDWNHREIPYNFKPSTNQ